MLATQMEDWSSWHAGNTVLPIAGRRPVADDLHPQAPCPRIEGLLASHAPRRGVASVLLLRMSWPSTAGRRVPFMPTARRTDRPSIHTNQVGDHTRSSHVLDSGWVARSPHESAVRGRHQLLTSDGASSWCDWRHRESGSVRSAARVDQGRSDHGQDLQEEDQIRVSAKSA